MTKTVLIFILCFISLAVAGEVGDIYFGSVVLKETPMEQLQNRVTELESQIEKLNEQPDK